MSLEALRARLSEYAKDLRLNLGSLASERRYAVAIRAMSAIAAAGARCFAPAMT